MRGVARGLCLLFLFVAVTSGAPAFAHADLVNINTADLAALETLNGIGPSKAQAIIDYRTQHGPFASIDQIMNVSGIGTATYAKIKDYITVGDASQSGTQTQASDTQTQSTTTSQTQTSDTQSTAQTSTAPSSSYVAPPTPELYADAGADRTVIVGADVTFTANAYDSDRQMVDPTLVRFSWNFGDGQTAEGQSVLHHYQYPGRYALVVNLAQDKNAAMDEAIVTAEPAKLSFAALQDGGVQIDNLAGRELDLSGWLVRAGDTLIAALFTLPPHSVILSDSSMRISRATLGFAAGAQAQLQYPNGVTALFAGETTSAAVATSAPASAQNVTVAAAPHTAPRIIAAAEIPAPEPTDNTPDATGTALSQTAAAASSVGGNVWWWGAAAALAAAAAGALVAAKRFGKKEWDIVEEK
jgi:competence ComEA-like helix-hairpin-helix protein